MTVFLVGTIILATQGPDAIYVGIDSKVLAIRERIKNPAPMPKPHQGGDVKVAHAGLFKDALGKIDRKAPADEAVIDRQAVATPEIVGLPTTILSVDKQGVHDLRGIH